MKLPITFFTRFNTHSGYIPVEYWLSLNSSLPRIDLECLDAKLKPNLSQSVPKSSTHTKTELVLKSVFTLEKVQYKIYSKQSKQMVFFL